MAGQWQEAAAPASKAVASKAGARRALIVAGPTASGKSALALMLARRLGGTVINADSMQVYRELRVLTARPGDADLALAPHALYGVRPAAEPGSAAWWRGEALAAMDAAAVPILCGGTGLYLRSLTAGLADIPDPGPEARTEARALLQALGPAALHARLAAADPATAATLRPTDGQRLARAWEVWRGTGRGLAGWHAAGHAAAAHVAGHAVSGHAASEHAAAGAPLSGWQFAAVLLDPPREALRPAIAARFAAMLDAGALAEVAALLDLGLDPALPAMRALGVPELAAHLRGTLTLAEATAQAVSATGRYTKRQATWFRHQILAPLGCTHTINARYASQAQDSERLTGYFQAFVQGNG